MNGTYTRMLRVVKDVSALKKTLNYMESFLSYLIRYKLIG
jgi:hypothetical protein